MTQNLKQIIKRHIRQWLFPLINRQVGLWAAIQREEELEWLRRTKEIDQWRQKKPTPKIKTTYSTPKITNRKTSP